MNIFISLLQKHQRVILVIVIASFVCAFLHLQNFDPSHPTIQNVSCIQGLPQCASYRDAFFSIVYTLLFFSGLYTSRYIWKTLCRVRVARYMEDYMYVPILSDPIRFSMRVGILHSKYH